MSITEPSYCDTSILDQGAADINKGSTDSIDYHKGDIDLLCDFFKQANREAEKIKSFYQILSAFSKRTSLYELENIFYSIINTDINIQNENETERLEKILWDLYENCNEDDWDCYGAIAIEKSIIDKSIMFLKYMPHAILSQLTNDNFCPNPHGTVTIDFYSSYGSVQAEIGLTRTNVIGEFENEEDPDEEELTWENFKINDNNMSIFRELIKKVIPSN